MKLSELFVSHKQVDPVSFEKNNPNLPETIYLNLNRAQKAATPEKEEDDMSTWNADKETYLYDWSVGYNPKVEAKSEIKKEEPILVPYRENPVEVKRGSYKLKEYRSGANYLRFKLELDTFIKNNPKYTSIKDSLDYLAALESSYKLGAENHLGSGALGWFQFMDGTRQAYNNLSRKDFANDALSLLLAAAKHYTNLLNNIRARGGDYNDFITMYGAWWRPESAYAYLKDNTYDYKTKYGESLSEIRLKAKDLIS